MTTALVLGAGGAGAWVFHTGVLAALAEAGEEPATHRPVVGTSAGSVAGAMLLLGLDQDGPVAEWLAPPSPEDRERMLGIVRENFTLRPAHGGLARRLMAGVPPLAAIAPLLPTGPFPTGTLVPWFDDDAPIPDGLWIPAVVMETAETVVFGKDRRDVGLKDALVATMAIPGMFQPKEIDGLAYMDGGTVSTTHADLVLDAGVDRVVIAAPMARPDHGWVLRHAHRRVQAEIERLTRAGVEVVAVLPGRDRQELFRGFPRRSTAAAEEIRRHGYEQTMAALG